MAARQAVAVRGRAPGVARRPRQLSAVRPASHTPPGGRRVDEGQKRRFSYVPGLDGVRAIAVLLIVIAHTYEQLLPKRLSLVDAYWTPMPGAVFGVDIFFALSGFLITALLYT